MVKVWLAVGEGGLGQREVLGSVSQPPAWHLLFCFSALYPAAWEPWASRASVCSFISVAPTPNWLSLLL